MFRRKEEDATDASAETTSQATMSMNLSSASQSQEPSSSSSAQAATASVQANPYAPAAVRPTAAATNSYRPTPMSDFTRPAAATARAAEPVQRTAGASSATAASASSVASPSFSSFSDKSSANKSNRRVLTVGNDILLKGEIATCDRLVIEGRVEAKLSDVHTVEIAECGSFKGTAEVEDAEISGVFEGDLIVRNRLVIYSSGEVRGNITYGEIEIERGGKLTGQIKTVAAGGVSATIQNVSKGGMSAQEVKARAVSKEFAA